MADKDVLADAREAFKDCQDAEAKNRQNALDDLKFARLAEQWNQADIKKRERQGRPALTINKLPSFIRQVVNESRQNRPQIKIRPIGEGADQSTAQIFDGLIRGIQVASNADVAYDTSADFACTMGFGYFRIDLDYAHDDTFDMDIRVERVANPFTIYGDPRSVEADSSDWNVAFVAERMSKDDYEAKYRDAAQIDWEFDGKQFPDWIGSEDIQVAEYWTRSESVRPIVQLSDGRILAADVYEKERAFLFDPAGITVKGTRNVRSWKVRQQIINGQEVLEDNEWSGRYIPIIPVYGEELNVEGERIFRSLIRDAKDAQRIYNYSRTAATELQALTPRVPWVGRKGSFQSDRKRWETANSENHAYLEYDGDTPPQRQMLDSGPAMGAMQEALSANDDMKAVMGMYDASLGARSNETSGRAILARQREGDVSTFHFADNLSRAIKHAGRIMLDLIPNVYNTPRIIRTMSEDGSTIPVPLMTPVVPQTKPGETQPSGYQPVPQGVMPPPGARVFDLTVGKYDVTVDVGPSFTTRREEAANQMVELTRATPAIAPMIADIMARNLDWPEADKVAERIKMTLPPHMRGEGPPPEVLQMQQQMQQMQQQMAQMAQQLQAAQGQLQSKQIESQTKLAEARIDADNAAADREVKMQELQVANRELDIKQMELAIKERELMAQTAAVTDAQGAQMVQFAQQLAGIAARVEQAFAAATQPRRRTGSAVKGADGRWMLEAIDEAPQLIQ